MNDVEAAGDLMTSGVIARAVEPRGVSAHGHSGDCLNCGAHLTGPHCWRCGQAAHVHRTAGGFLHEILHGVFHFEGKFWRTLPLLAFKPGHLTCRYIDGERAKFVSPVAMFLFSVFLMFTVVSSLSKGVDANDLSEGFLDGFTDSVAGLVRRTSEARATVATLEAQRRSAIAARRSVAEIDAKLVKARGALRKLQQTARGLPVPANASPKVTADIAAAANAAEPVEPTASERKNWFDARVENARKNPALLLYKMKTAAYKYSWALIPMSLPFLWMMFFWRRGVGMYDHAIFATYSLSFVSLLTVALTLVGKLPGNAATGLAATLFLVIPPVHMYKQLRYGYRLRRFSAIWRTFALLVIVTVTSTMFFLLLLYLGVAD